MSPPPMMMRFMKVDLPTGISLKQTNYNLYLKTLRPAPDGKSVRLPFAPSTRTLLRAADANEVEQQCRMSQQNYTTALRLQRGAELNSPSQTYHRKPPGSIGSLLSEAHKQQRYALTDRLVGEALQLGRYMDPAVVEVARRELAEAYELDERQLDSAAFRLTTAAAAASASGNHFSNGRTLPLVGPPISTYLEHVGGFAPEELSDINQYSQHSLLRPASKANCLNSGMISSTAPKQQSQDQADEDDELLLVTTL